jgi:hypothetical protein
MQTFMDGFSLTSDKGKGTTVSMFRAIGGEITPQAAKERLDA